MSTPILIDNFNRANATTLGTVDYGTWTQTAADRPSVNANTWYTGGSSANASIPRKAGSYASIGATIWQSEDGTTGNPFGQLYLAATNALDSSESYFFNLTHLALTLSRNTGGAITTLATTSAYNLTNTPKDLKLELVSGTVYLYVDGTLALSAADTTFDESDITHYRVRTNRVGTVTGSWVRVDDVYTYPPPAPTTTFRRRHRLAMSGV